MWLDPVTQFDQIYKEEYEKLRIKIDSMIHDQGAAEDITQDAFLKAYSVRHTYKPTAPPGAWIRRIGINLAISHLRHRAVVDKFAESFPSSTESEAKEVENKMLVETLLKKLKPNELQAIKLYYYSRYTDPFLSKELSIPISTISGLRRRAMNRLREHSYLVQ